MINNFLISYDYHGTNIALSVAEDESIERLPVNLAEMFAMVIRCSDVNARVCIQELAWNFGFDLEKIEAKNMACPTNSQKP